MGAHGLYVWSVYGFSSLVLTWLIWDTLSTRRKTRDRLRKRFMRNQTL
ncbi:heme exporter protein CcmD [Marinomonas foliarum]|nr:heme exporter protein CcmD [Marinomonas foliarum]